MGNHKTPQKDISKKRYVDNIQFTNIRAIYDNTGRKDQYSIVYVNVIPMSRSFVIKPP